MFQHISKSRNSLKFVRYNTTNSNNDKIGGFDLNSLFKRLDIATETNKTRLNNAVKKTPNFNRFKKQTQGDKSQTQKLQNTNSKSNTDKQPQFRPRSIRTDDKSTTQFTPRSPNNYERKQFKPINVDKFVDSEQKQSRSFRFNKSDSSTKPDPKPFKRNLPTRQQTRPRRDLADSKPSVAPPIESKHLTATPYQPKIIPEDFFYNKVPSLQSSKTQRLSSIAKLSLVESNYPYKLPKEVIEKAPKATKSRFLLSKSSWNLTPQINVLSDRIKQMYYGKIPQVKNTNNDQLSMVTSSYLINNGGLHLTQKQQMFDIINGKVDLKTIFKDAHWKKQPVKKAKVEEKTAAPVQTGKKKGKK